MASRRGGWASGILAVSLLYVTANAWGASWVSIDGDVRLDDGTPICAMVLANGQYMFSCDGNGSYFLNVPLDGNGEITLFSFADGFAPFSFTGGPADLPYTVFMEKAPPSSPRIDLSRNATCASNDWIRVSGQVRSASGSPLCAMVLANGQQMFTCEGRLGQYGLTVPADQNGEVTIFGFADGFQPFRETFKAPVCETRFAVINGVELRYRLVEASLSYISELFCAVQVDMVNKSSTTKSGFLRFDAFSAPRQYLASADVFVYLPPDSSASNDPWFAGEGMFVGLRSQGFHRCADFSSWYLNADSSFIH